MRKPLCIALLLVATCEAQFVNGNLRNGLLVGGAAAAAGGGGGCDSVNDSSLQAYWRCDEASGTREDTKGANDLADNNTVTATTGKVGDCAVFTAANSEYLNIADNPELSTGPGVSFTLACWIFPTTIDANIRAIAGKNGIADPYALFIWNDDKIRWALNNGAKEVRSASALTVNTWYHVIAEYDSGAGEMRLYVNDGAAQTTTGVSDTSDTADTFYVGIYSASSFPYDGRIDELFFTKRLLTSGERTALYNSGSGCRPSGL